jgi:hypothetical protein
MIYLFLILIFKIVSSREIIFEEDSFYEESFSFDDTIYLDLN